MSRALTIIGVILLTIFIAGVSGLTGFAVGYILDLIFGEVSTLLVAYIFAGVALLAWLIYVVFFAAAAIFARKKTKEFDQEFGKKFGEEFRKGYAERQK